MALTILLTLILIGLSILVWCKWEERKWLDDGEYIHLSKPKREFIEKQLAEARAAVDDKLVDDAWIPVDLSHEFIGKSPNFIKRCETDDKMPDDAIFIKPKPKAMTVPIKRNKPKKHIQ